MTGFAADVLGIVPMGLDAGVVGSGEVAVLVPVALGAAFRADEFGTVDLRWQDNRAGDGGAGDGGEDRGDQPDKEDDGGSLEFHR